MSYEERPENIKDALNKLLRVYGAPLGMLLVIVLGALYLFVSPGRDGSPAFPRSAVDPAAAGRAEARLKELSGELRSTPDDLKALDESGCLKFQLGPARYPEAIADLEKAESLGLTDARAFYYLGVMYQGVGLYDFAEHNYRKFLNNYPRDREARMLLAKLYYSSGKYPEAAQEFAEIRRRGSTDPVLLENLTLSRWKAGQDYSGPLSELRSAGGPGAFLADYAEGTIKYGAKDYAGALPLLEKAAEASDPYGAFADRQELFWMTGTAAVRANDYAAASRYLQLLLQLDPAREEARRMLAVAEKKLAAKARRAGKQGRPSGGK